MKTRIAPTRNKKKTRSMDGWIQKRGDGFPYRYSKRFFHLTAEALEYFTDAEKQNKRGKTCAET
jgi:hypothetical protein